MPEEHPTSPSWQTGTHGEYSWVSTTSFGIDDLLEVCPAVLLNKFVAVTSCDSGPLPLDEQSLAAGWRIQNGIAYSPQITSPDLFPYHVHFDEWYVFPEIAGFDKVRGANPKPESMEIYVNYYFRFDNPDTQHLATAMWQLLEQLRPESYIAEADWGWMTLITRNQKVFETLVDTLTKRAHQR